MLLFAFSGTLRETVLSQYRHTSLVISVDAVPVVIVVKCNRTENKQSASNPTGTYHLRNAMLV